MSRPLSLARCAVLLVDYQERHLRHLPDARRAQMIRDVADLRWLARKLEVPLLITELELRALGRTIPALAGGRPHQRKHLDATQHAPLLDALRATGRDTVVLAGMETHTGVVQSAVGLLSQGFQVWALHDLTQAETADHHTVGVAMLRHLRVGPLTLDALAAAWVPQVDDPLFAELRRRR